MRKVRDNFRDCNASELLAIYNYIGYQIDNLRDEWEDLNRTQYEIALMIRELNEPENNPPLDETEKEV
jgi:hypothetical protein